MSNQLLIPFKRSSPADIKSAVRQYIQAHHPETHPDAFRWDVTHWEALRSEAIAEGTHVSKIQAFLTYQAQLVFILTKLPPDIDLDFTYDPVFRTSPTSPVTLRNICYERVCVLYNLASLYCKLAIDQDTESAEGIKHASNYFQSAAGTLSHLVNSALPALQATHGRPLPIDLTEPFFGSLQWLMIAQAQECAWQKARSANSSNAVVARLAMGVSSLYKKMLETIENVSNPIASAFTHEWRTHIHIKALHFEAAAQYRKAIDDNEAGRYGDEVARLGVAQECSQKGDNLCRKTKAISKIVQTNARDLLTSITSDLARSTRDNDLIYHKDVPSPSSLPIIVEATVAKLVVAPELLQPERLVGSANEPPIFGELVAHGVRTAVELYEDRRSNWIKEEVLNLQKTLNSEVTITLQELNLPASIDALDKRVGLPPSLLAKAEEVRRDGGAVRVATMMNDRKRFSEQASHVLEEAFDILDQEAEEDAEFSREYSKHDVWDRPPSHEVNQDLTATIQKYEAALTTARESDEKVNDSWSQWHDIVEILGRSDPEIEAFVPSVTMSDQTREMSSGSAITQRHARAIRDLLEQLDGLTSERSETVDRVQRVAAADDIQPRISRQAQGLERWVEVTPAMFEDTIASELEKYEQYKDELESSRERQDELLGQVLDANEVFLRSRHADPAVKDRQRALQTLGQAYDEYSETVRNLTDGTLFYNKLAAVATQLREDCKKWVEERRKGVKWLTDALIDVKKGNTAVPGATALPPQAAPQASLPLPAPPREPIFTPPIESRPFTSAPVASSLPTDSPRATGTWQPRSSIAQQAMAASPAGMSKTGKPRVSAAAAAAALPSPWKQPQLARELDDAEWDEEPLPPPPPPKKLVRDLMNDDDWEDGTIVPPVAVASASKSKKPAKSKGVSDEQAPAPDVAGHNTRSRRTRLPA